MDSELSDLLAFTQIVLSEDQREHQTDDISHLHVDDTHGDMKNYTEKCF